MVSEEMPMRMNFIARRGQRGYNLVEVLIAMALLAVVALTIMTLFFMGRRNVYSGKQMTHAVSVGTRISEDLSSLPVPTIYAGFNVASTEPIGSVTVQPSSLPESAYTGSFSRSTTSVAANAANQCTVSPNITFTNDTNGFLQRWYCQMQSSSNQLPNGSITLVFTPRLPSANPLTATNATVVRIRAIIRWTEELRNRQLIVDMTKTNE